MEEPIRLSVQEAIIYFALIGAAVGFVLGLIPFCFGFFRNRKKLGILGIITSTIGGAIQPVFLAVPAVIIFTWLIIRNPKAPETDSSAVDQEPN
jgi:hypothetical protein